MSTLIPKDRWPALHPEVCQQVHAPEHGVVRLEERGRELVELFAQVEHLEEGQPETREIACVEREDLHPTTLGLTLFRAAPQQMAACPPESNAL